MQRIQRFGHVQHIGPEVFHRTEALGVFRVPGAGAAFLEHVVLQLALTGLIADWAVEWMVDQQQLEYALASLLGLFAVDKHYLSFGHLGHAGRHQLRGFLDLDQAHAAHRRRWKRRVIAVVRHQNAGLFGGLDDSRPLGDAHRGAIDG